MADNERLDPTEQMEGDEPSVSTVADGEGRRPLSDPAVRRELLDHLGVAKGSDVPREGLKN